ncbi:hypothetical protein CDAR_373301 [Caerostris darwini]|uniref:Uncharacterized protein n=1 Tax=Caerostris darwini TaxID=1538125 RepID=A0AAV4N2L9_9ARAC|nr:hypothetical protein CDAR_373301 [Caerostris darwini]
MQYICFMDKTKQERQRYYLWISFQWISAIPPFFTRPLSETRQSPKSSSFAIHRNDPPAQDTLWPDIRKVHLLFLFLIPLPKTNKNVGLCRIKLPESSLSALQRQRENEEEPSGNGIFSIGLLGFYPLVCNWPVRISVLMALVHLKKKIKFVFNIFT